MDNRKNVNQVRNLYSKHKRNFISSLMKFIQQALLIEYLVAWNRGPPTNHSRTLGEVKLEMNIVQNVGG